jgi:hypothetical protein
MASLSTILTWFKRKKKPTEAQFAETFSSFRHIDDLVPLSEVSGLEGALAQRATVQALNTLAQIKADLVDGKVPITQLPSFENEIFEYPTVGDFPLSGENGKIYIAIDTNFIYRWGGSAYINIGNGIGGGVSYFTKNGNTLYTSMGERLMFGSNSQQADANIHQLLGAGAWGTIIQPNNYNVDYGVQFTNNIGVANRFFGQGYYSFDNVNQTTRPNVVGTFWGYNSGLLGGRNVATDHGFSFRTETYYQIYGQNDPGWVELHLPEFYSTDSRWTRLDSIYVLRSNGEAFRNVIIPQNYWFYNKPTPGQMYQFGALISSASNGTAYTLNSENGNSNILLQYTLDGNTILGAGSMELQHGDVNNLRFLSTNSLSKQSRITIQSQTIDLPFTDGLKKIVLRNNCKFLMQGNMLLGDDGYSELPTLPIGLTIGQAIDGGSWENPNSKAVLELRSITKGFIPTRMTGSQAEAISPGAGEEGMLIYASDGSGATINSKGWWGWTGTIWQKLN